MRKFVLLMLVGLFVLMAGCGGGGSSTLGLDDADITTSAAKGGKTKPVAVPGAFPTEGGVPMLVHLFDDGSYDLDGEIVKWEWNFSGQGNGNGGWHDYTVTRGAAMHYYERPGTIVAHLRVTDNDGNTDVQQIKIKRGETSPEIESLMLEGLSAESGKPGALITATGDWIAAGEEPLQIDWGGGLLAHVIPDAEGNPVFAVAPLDAGSYSLRVVAGDNVSNSLQFEILPIGTLPYTQAEFATLIDASLTGMSAKVSGLLAQLGTHAECGLTAEEIARLRYWLSELQDYAGEVGLDIAGLPAEDAEVLQCIMHESGVLELLAGFAEPAGHGTSAQVALQEVLISLDVISAVLTNAKTIFELPMGLLGKIPLLKAGKLIKAFKSAHGAVLAIVCIDYLIDAFIPTDLKTVDHEGVHYTAIKVPDEITIEVGETAPYLIHGNFTNEQTILAATFEELLGFTLHELFGLFDPTGGQFGSGFVDEVLEFIQDLAVKAEVNLAAYIFAEITEHEDQEFILPPVNVQLDMAQYNTSLSDLLAPLFPEGFVQRYRRFMEKMGWEYVLVDSVQVEEDYVSYSYANETVTGLAVSNDLTSSRAIGTVFRDTDLLWGLLTYADYVNVDDRGLITVAEPPPPSDPRAWPMFGRNALHASQSPYVGAQTNNVKWTYPTGDWIRSSPAIGVDGTVYMGSDNNKLYAFNPDGSLQWSYTTGGNVESSPAIGPDGTIYVGTHYSAGKLYAVNPNGTLKWTYSMGGSVHSSPVVDLDGTVYVGSYNGRLYAINPNGSKKWSYTTGGVVLSSPAIGTDGTVYVGSYDKKLHAINPDGSPKWKFTTGDRVVSSPTIAADGTIYVGSYDNRFYAVNPDGSLKWSYATGARVYSSPAIGTDGTVYVGSFDNTFYAFDPNGNLQWSYTTGDRVTSSPSIGGDGTIYLGSEDSNVYAFNPDGSVLWTYTTGGAVRTSPSISEDGTVYAASYDGKLYAFGL